MKKVLMLSVSAMLLAYAGNGMAVQFISPAFPVLEGCDFMESHAPQFDCDTVEEVVKMRSGDTLQTTVEGRPFALTRTAKRPVSLRNGKTMYELAVSRPGAAFEIGKIDFVVDQATGTNPGYNCYPSPRETILYQRGPESIPALETKAEFAQINDINN
ncbi:MAG: hypothetical protein K0S08_1006 [Gammaproteobacteria bacterium]|jgi:hypothetical protein|nr:hypothetical protein [Gammaproteobacteria bacterium]